MFHGNAPRRSRSTSFGLLTLRNGRWRDRQILSEAWLRMARTPTPAETDYGFMNYFLNTDRKLLPSAPADAFVHLGAGQNTIYVDPGHRGSTRTHWTSPDAAARTVST